MDRTLSLLLLPPDSSTLIQIKATLDTAPLSWVQEFEQLGGIDSLFDHLHILQSSAPGAPGGAASDDDEDTDLLHEEVIHTIASAMGTVHGLETVASSPEYVSRLVSSTYSPNSSIVRHASHLLTGMARYSPTALTTILQAFRTTVTDYPRFRLPYQHFVDALAQTPPLDEEGKSHSIILMRLINALVDSSPSAPARTALRTALAANTTWEPAFSAMHDRIAEASKDNPIAHALQQEIDAYLSSEAHDAALASFGDLSLDDPVAIVRLLQTNLRAGGGAYGFFLSLLQSLLSIPARSEGATVIWQGIAEMVASLIEGGGDSRSSNSNSNSNSSGGLGLEELKVKIAAKDVLDSHTQIQASLKKKIGQLEETVTVLKAENPEVAATLLAAQTETTSLIRGLKESRACAVRAAEQARRASTQKRESELEVWAERVHGLEEELQGLRAELANAKKSLSAHKRLAGISSASVPLKAVIKLKRFAKRARKRRQTEPTGGVMSSGPPPPPPPPGGGPPPPPPPPGGGPPPPPPPPGGGPPPPPGAPGGPGGPGGGPKLIGGFTRSTTKLRKLRLSSLTAKKVAGTLFESMTPSSSPLGLNLTSLDTLFTSQPPTTSSGGTGTDAAKPKKPKVMEVIDGKAAQKIGIVVALFRDRDANGIRDAILGVDMEVLTEENVKRLASAVPSPEDEEAVRSYLVSPVDGIVLGKASTFVAAVMDVPALSQILELVLFKHEFGVLIREAEEAVATVLSCVSSIVAGSSSSGALRQIMELVLNILNYAATGGRPVLGFQVSGLNALGETKSVDGKTTMLRVLVAHVRSQAPGIETKMVEEELVECPAAARKPLKAYVAPMVRKLAGRTHKMAGVLAGMGSEMGATGSRLHALLDQGMAGWVARVDELVQDLDHLEEAASGLVKSFGEDVTKVDVSDVFAALAEFRVRWEKAGEDNVKAAKRAEARRKRLEVGRGGGRGGGGSGGGRRRGKRGESAIDLAALAAV